MSIPIISGNIVEINYSQGRFTVYDINGTKIGGIDGDEFIRQGPRLLYRIDGTEGYEINGKLLAFIENGIAKSSNGEKIFAIRPE